MKLSGLGLKGKFVVALLVAAALPFLVGLVIFESTGYEHLLEERGRFHQMQAMAMVRSLDQASEAEGGRLRAWLSADARLLDLTVAINREFAGRDAEQTALETHRLDEAWLALPAGDPQVRAALENPGSTSLRKFNAHYPEVAEILATDSLGRLIAATGKTSDFDQADEAWWQTGAKLGDGEQWTDVLRFDASSGVFSQDVVLPLHDGGALAGVVKMSVDVTSLFARQSIIGGSFFDRWEIVLPDGRILANSESGYVPMSDRLSNEAMDAVRLDTNGWALVRENESKPRMLGFARMGPPGNSANPHVLFSSQRDDVVGPLRIAFLEIGAAASLMLAVFVLLGFHLIRSNILAPLSTLARAARSISNIARLRESLPGDASVIERQRMDALNNLAAIRCIRTGDEVEALAADISVMTSSVMDYQREMESEVAAKTAVIREDLELAREFQNALLPSSYPEVPPSTVENPLRLQFAHFYQPASTVGGDFFDLIELDDYRVGILIADVMGHGARSALVTAILRALVRNHSSSIDEPGVFLSELNHHLMELISRGGRTMFVTAFFLILDTRNASASWAVAGHPAPLRVRRGSGRAPEPLWSGPQHQPALGLVADAVFVTHETPLKAGDVFLLYTDGAVEAEDPEGANFGIERLAASMEDALDGPMAAMPAKIVCDVTAFQHRRHYDDDVCLVAVEAVSTGHVA